MELSREPQSRNKPNLMYQRILCLGAVAFIVAGCSGGSSSSAQPVSNDPPATVSLSASSTAERLLLRSYRFRCRWQRERVFERGRKDDPMILGDLGLRE